MIHVVQCHTYSLSFRQQGDVTSSPATCIYSTTSYDITAYYKHGLNLHVTALSTSNGKAVTQRATKTYGGVVVQATLTLNLSARRSYISLTSRPL
jgi:hypothetical protein